MKQIVLILAVGLAAIPAIAASKHQAPRKTKMSTAASKLLPEDQRRAVFYEISVAGDRAEREAQKMYPTNGGTTAASMRRAEDNVMPESDMSNRLTERYHKQVQHRFKLSENQMDAIMTEGVTKRWPHTHH